MKVRAYPKDCKERTPEKLVVGWYAYVSHTSLANRIVWRHVLYVPKKFGVTECIEIDHTTAAYETGKLDKHGKMIFGSKGEMQGGDKVRIRARAEGVWSVAWNTSAYAWVLNHTERMPRCLLLRDGHELEIITDEKGGA